MASVCTAPPAILEHVDRARVLQIVDIPAFLRIELSNINLICYLQPTINNQYDVYLAILPSHHLPPRLSNRQKLLDSFYKVGGLSRKPKNLFFVKKRPLWPFFMYLFQDFSRSTRFLCLRTAKTSKFQLNIVKLFWRNEMKFHFIPILVDEFWSFFREILMKFSQNFTDILRK